MIAYIIGEVTHHIEDGIILECNSIGYNIVCPNRYEYTLNNTYKVFTYQHVREDTNMLFGFVSLESLSLFKMLIQVKGIGPKTGINILGASGTERLLEAIENEDVSYLKTLPGIGAKSASQMILDLKGKLVSKDIPTKNTNLKEVEDALLSLGFKTKEINSIRNELVEVSDQNINVVIKYGLQLLQARKKGG